NAAKGESGLSMRMDSLLFVEKKLIEVIDSMTSLVDRDHSRILQLEEQLHQVQNATVPLPPTEDRDEHSGIDHSNGRHDSYTPPATPPAAPPTFQERYTRALATFNTSDFESALSQFQSLEQDDPNGSYASRYKYWEGECYYGEKKFQDAMDAFKTVLEHYPNSLKAAASQYKIGECHEQMKQTDDARTAYERVLADYPDSEYRSRAIARLKSLKITKNL
ncbi:MAG TPA: tetratricopeptide repeat protein, partial [Candidatus Kapabacteria bacterium]